MELEPIAKQNMGLKKLMNRKTIPTILLVLFTSSVAFFLGIQIGQQRAYRSLLRPLSFPIDSASPSPDWIAKKDDNLVTSTSSEPTPIMEISYLEAGERMIFPEIGISLVSPEKLQIDLRVSKRIHFLFLAEAESQLEENSYSLSIDRVSKEKTTPFETFSQELACPDEKITFICNNPSEEVVQLDKTECTQKTYQKCMSDLKKATNPISSSIGKGIMFEHNPYELPVFQVVLEISPTELLVISTSGLGAGSDVPERGKTTIQRILPLLELVQ